MTRPHGYARYCLDGCRCNICGWARYLYDSSRLKQIAAGTWQPFVDAEPVVEHLKRLAAAGISRRQISKHAGVGVGTLHRLYHGRAGTSPSGRVRHEIAQAILALSPTPAYQAPGAHTDGTGTARRIQGLCAIGWTFTEQAQRYGCSHRNYRRLVEGRPVMGTTARKVADLYDQLSMTPPPDTVNARRVRERAAAEGWAPPLAWDDDKIDDPNAKPGGWIGQPQQESLEEFVARYRPLADQGLPWSEIAQQLGVGVNAAKKRIGRARQAGLVATSSEQVAA